MTSRKPGSRSQDAREYQTGTWTLWLGISVRFTGRAASACWNSSLYVQRQLGHSSIRITVDVYGRWLPTGNRDAVDRLAGVNEFELWSQGIHARAGVSCADCHMPYKREGAIKVSDHHVRSPLLNTARVMPDVPQRDGD